MRMLMFTMFIAVGCGGSSPPAGGTGGNVGDGGGGLPTGGDLAMAADMTVGGCAATSSVCGHVTYGGAKAGVLGVAAYPTMTPGIPDKFVTVMQPAFPQAYALEGLADGDHYLQAILFVGHAPGQPMPGDPQSTVQKVTVQAGVAAMLDLALVDN